MAFYANTLYTPTVLQDVGFVPSGAEPSIYRRLAMMAVGNGMVALMGGLPGALRTMALLREEEQGGRERRARSLQCLPVTWS